MRRDHAEQVMEALEPLLKINDDRVREMLIGNIMDVTLKSGPEPSSYAVSKAKYIKRARQCAREWLKNHHDVCVQDIVDEIGIPSGLAPDTVGGIFKHSDFTKNGTKNISMPKGHKPKTKTVNTYVLTSSQNQNNNLIVSWD
jgi:hypothetical protein